MEVSNILKEVKNKEKWKLFEEIYSNTTVFDQINMHRFEDIHTNFLSNLFKEDNIYRLDCKPLKLLLMELKIPKNNNNSKLKLQQHDKVPVVFWSEFVFW